MKIINVIIVDRYPAMRSGLKLFLSQKDVVVVGETGSGEEAIRLIKKLEPDLVVLALNLVKPDGIITCEKIKALPRAPYVLIYTGYNFAQDISSCITAQADSYLHKDTNREALLSAARRTVAGEKIWKVGHHIGEERTVINTTPEGERLTSRETEVLGLKFRGRSNARIAEELGIKVNTVKRHVNSIYGKIPNLKEVL